MGLTLVDALFRPLRCACDCHRTLGLEERTEGVRAMFRFDDALRGWGYQPIYEIGADRLYREAQRKNDETYRGIAVRDEACVYRRLVGFAVHELIHALSGDPGRANYGIPFGLPYGVPPDVPEGREAEYLDRFNRGEARAWVGVAKVARAFFGIEWTLRTARDVGTYGFPVPPDRLIGGKPPALVEVPEGFRPVPHVDRVHHPQRYYALARKLEEEEEGFFTDERIAEWQARFEEAEAAGQKRRKQPWPEARALAAREPEKVGRNNPCPCGSGRKYKQCCARE